MNLYTSIASRIASSEAAALSVRLSAWHDAMVAHERRLASGRGFDACDDECPHEDARLLWAEAVAILGEGAAECEFLRSHGSVHTATSVLVAAHSIESLDGLGG